MTGPVRSGRLAVDGGSLYWEASGEGPAVLLAHGLGGNHMSWWQQVPALSRRFTCVVIAHRGFLPSTDETGTPRPERYADDALALLDHLSIDQAAIVAQSMGGWTALELALRHPERVRALVMSGTSGSLAPPPDAAAGPAPVERDLFARGIHPAAGERMAREQPELHQLYRQIAASTGGWDRERVRAALYGLRTRTPEEVAAVRQPMLAMAGEEDAVATTAHVERLAATIPGATYHPIPRSGHSPYFERPESSTGW